MRSIDDNYTPASKRSATNPENNAQHSDESRGPFHSVWDLHRFAQLMKEEEQKVEQRQKVLIVPETED